MNIGTVDFELPVDATAVARWLYARDGDMRAPPQAGAAIPLPYLVFLRAQPILGVNFHHLLDRDPDRGLYGGVTYTSLRPLRVGHVLHATGEVTAREKVESPRGVLTLTTYTTTYREGADVVAVEEVRMVDLPTADGTSSSQPPHGARQPKSPHAARIAPITRNQVAWLTVETGDINALHLDAAYAASRGYPDVVVPATLLTALFERELTLFANVEGEARWGELNTRYHAPTYPAEALDLHARIEGGVVSFEVFAAGTLRASGRALLGEAA